MNYFYAVPKEQQNFSPESQIRLISCGNDHDEERPRHFVRTRKDYYLTFVKTGKARYIRGGEQFTAKSGDMFLYFPDERQELFFDVDAGETVVYWVHFFGEGVRPLLERLGLVGGFFRPDGANEIIDLYEKLFRLYKTKSPFYEVTALGVLYELLAAVAREDDSFDKEKMLLVVEKLHEPPTLSVGECAALCHYTPAHFSRLFKKRYGTSPGEYKRELVIERAKALLSTSELSVSDIASRIGFDDVLYFWKFFKRLVGVTPLAYREQAKVTF